MWLALSSSTFAQSIKVTIDAPEGMRPGSKATVNVKVNNRLGTILPESLHVYGLVGGKKITLGNSSLARSTQGKKKLSKTHGATVQTGYIKLTENIGAMARMPRTKFQPVGKESFTSFSLLPRYRSLTRSYSFKVPANGRQIQFSAQFTYRDFPRSPQFTVYQQFTPKSKSKSTSKRPTPSHRQPPIGRRPGIPGKMGRSRWITDRSAVRHYRKWNPTSSKSLPTSSRYKWLTDKKTYQKLPSHQVVTRSKSAIYALSFNLSHAVAKAKLEGVKRYLYYIPLDSWVLVKDNKTYFVNWQSVQVLEGDHMSMVKKLNSRPTLRPYVYHYADKKDPQGRGAILKGKGFLVIPERAKGGMKSARVVIPAERIIDYLKISSLWK